MCNIACSLKMKLRTMDLHGGVFFGRKYTTNFTITDTDFASYSAGNGGVFYLRRFNSHVNNIIHSLKILLTTREVLWT